MSDLITIEELQKANKIDNKAVNSTELTVDIDFPHFRTVDPIGRGIQYGRVTICYKTVLQRSIEPHSLEKYLAAYANVADHQENIAYAIYGDVQYALDCKNTPNVLRVDLAYIISSGSEYNTTVGSL